jgi:membrane-bound lytic murein transglycosylase D
MEQTKTLLAVLCACLVTQTLLPVYSFSAEQTALKTDEQCALQPSTTCQIETQTDENIEDALDETVEVSTPTPAVPVYSAEIQKSVKQAEAFYRKAVIFYEQGDKKKADELFRESMKALAAAQLDGYAFYNSKDGLDSMFNNFTALFSLSESTGPAENKYTIPMDKDNEQVKKYLSLYSRGDCGERIKRALERSGRYRAMIEKILKEYGLPRELVYLPVVESLYNVNDRSRCGALGLWQFMPSRARDFKIHINYWIDERMDPEKSTRAAAQYLRDLYYMFDNWHLALAAYDRGEFGLARDLKFSKATNIEQMKERRAVPKETELYVPQFIACTIIGDNPKQYGLDLKYDEPIKYDEVSLDKIVDLEVAAKCAGTNVATIKELNPALKAWCTPHGYEGFILKIPSGTKDAFITNLAQTKELNPSRGFIKYRVVKGDFLGRIAKKFSTSVSELKADNKIKNDKSLRIGQVLVIRPGRKYKGS